MLNRPEKILLYSNNLWFLAEGMLGPLIAVFALGIGGNILNISWAIAGYLVVTGLTNILIGYLCDHGLNKAKVMTIGFGLNALFTFSYIFVRSPLQLFAVQVCLGIATAMTIPTWYALYAKHESRKHDAMTWGIAKGEAYIIMGVAILMGGFISNQFGFKVLFVIMSAVQLTATLSVSRLIKSELPK